MSANTSESTPPPTAALPQLPTSKIRAPSGTFAASRFSPATSSFPATSLRTPSKLIRPTAPLSPNHTASSPNLPTLKSTANANASTHAADDTSSSEKAVRRSVSIANFPEPPKARRAGGSKRGSAGSTIGSERGADREARANSLRIKKLRTKASTGSLSQAYLNGAAPSLLNGKGDSQSVPGSGEAGVQSPPHSRSSSAQGSYSTSATTFEDPDEKRSPPDDAGERRKGRDSGPRDKESKGNVIVSVRVRPDASGDKTSTRDWLVDGRQSLIAYRGREGGDYFYDHVFAPFDNNEKVYNSIAKRLVHRVMEGYHGTVFAYGMTGTGKTFSMQGTKDSLGVIPSAVKDIFSYIRETPEREFLLRVSYLEIYNEKILDLLSPPTATSNAPGAPQPEEIKLREDSKRGVFAFPLKEEIVQSPTQLIRVIARGDQSRKTRSTQFNAQSSRSHAVVQIIVESRERVVSGNSLSDKRAALVPGGVRVSTLSMIDLAGSERAAESKERRTEGAHINKSLLTLGNVISRLSGDKDGNGNPTDKEGKHLPYRDSKLTRLLQPALSGNSLVSILCTIQIGSAGSVATASGHTGETLNTLKFAARAKNNIVSHAKKAEESTGAGGDSVLLTRLRMEIQELKSQLEVQKKEQDRRVEEEERGAILADHQRQQEQIIEMHIARTALTRRMEDLRRLIIDSKSSGVNASGKLSSLSMYQGSSMHHKSESTTRTIRSLRSSGSHSTLGTATPSLSREISVRSTATIGPRPSAEAHRSPDSSPDIDEEDEDTFGDGTASESARIRALQSDLADKNRYILTLEKRLLQARRSSQSRTSLLLSPRNFSTVEEDSTNTAALLKEKDAEIADLRARLDDKDRMVNALRSAARNRDNADPTSPGLVSSPSFTTPKKTSISPVVNTNANTNPFTTFVPPTTHQSKASNDTTGSSAGPGSTTHLQSPPRIETSGVLSKSSVSPVQLLSPPRDKDKDRDKDGNGKEKDMKRKSIDEMTKILDGMISDRVQTGNLVVGANGIIKPAHERRKESLGAVPSVGALAAQLRPTSTVSEIAES